jgi:hypothetical protein
MHKINILILVVSISSFSCESPVIKESYKGLTFKMDAVTLTVSHDFPLKQDLALLGYGGPSGNTSFIITSQTTTNEKTAMIDLIECHFGSEKTTTTKIPKVPLINIYNQDYLDGKLLIHGEDYIHHNQQVTVVWNGKDLIDFSNKVPRSLYRPGVFWDPESQVEGLIISNQDENLIRFNLKTNESSPLLNKHIIYQRADRMLNLEQLEEGGTGKQIIYDLNAGESSDILLSDLPDHRLGNHLVLYLSPEMHLETSNFIGNIESKHYFHVVDSNTGHSVRFDLNNLIAIGKPFVRISENTFGLIFMDYSGISHFVTVEVSISGKISSDWYTPPEYYKPKALVSLINRIR